jgi:TRAP-type mannitol/chloroaromatic compound transport system permease small subunit
MNYAIFAIVSWVIATILIAIVGKKSLLKVFGMPKNKFLKADWRGYLVTAMFLGAAISIGITYLIKSFA